MAVCAAGNRPRARAPHGQAGDLKRTDNQSSAGTETMKAPEAAQRTKPTHANQAEPDNTKPGRQATQNRGAKRLGRRSASPAKEASGKRSARAGKNARPHGATRRGYAARRFFPRRAREVFGASYESKRLTPARSASAQVKRALNSRPPAKIQKTRLTQTASWQPRASIRLVSCRGLPPAKTG
jgi:hypothetical protein